MNYAKKENALNLVFYACTNIEFLMLLHICICLVFEAQLLAFLLIIALLLLKITVL